MRLTESWWVSLTLIRTHWDSLSLLFLLVCDRFWWFDSSRKLSGANWSSAYTLVIFLFFSHNYDFFPKSVIKMVRISQNFMLFRNFRSNIALVMWNWYCYMILHILITNTILCQTSLIQVNSLKLGLFIMTIFYL